ncbi:hypothetical protein BDF20DRAFT_820962, partial [Mycotypha africana]|uniref:uncharacterized protein n=1 Tax=Mycotypha africana TaxID=64632 RepID=UPI002300F392
PGSDQVSKFVLKHPDVRSIITRALMDTNGDAYRIGDSKWDHGLRSDVVYEPMHVSFDQPPIIVEVQATVNADFMNRVAHYCIMAYRRYKVLPILLIFNTQTTSINTNDRSSLNKFSALSLSCEYWAKKCYLVNAKSVSSETNNELHPFTVIAVFLIKQQTCLLEIDPVTQLLFQIAKDFLEQSIKHETELLNTLISICNIGIQHYERILNTTERMQYDSPSLQEESVSGIQKLQQVKRLFEEVDTEEPSYDTTVGKSANEERYENTMRFVETYKSTRKRMNWRDCYAQLKQKTDVIKYKNAEVLRVQYNRFKKND